MSKRKRICLKHNVDEIRSFIRKNPETDHHKFKKKFPKVCYSVFRYHRDFVRKEKGNVIKRSVTYNSKPTIYASIWRYPKSSVKEGTKKAINSLVNALNASEMIKLEMVSMDNPPMIEIRTKAK